MRYRRNPFGDIMEIQKQVDQMFDSFFQDRAMSNAATLRQDHWKPPMDVYETTDTFIIRVELPGIDPSQDVQIQLSDNILTIRGCRRDRSPRNKQHYHLAEVSYGSFERVIQLADVIHDEAQPEARYDDGFLEVTLPKEAQAAVRNIPVQVVGEENTVDIKSPDPPLPEGPDREETE